MYPLVLTGDYHVTGAYSDHGPAGVPVMAYSPGSTCLQALNEAPNKFLGIVNAVPPGVDWVQLPTRPIYRYNCQDEASFAVALAEIREPLPNATHLPEEIQKPILQVRFSDKLQEAYSRIVAAAGDRYHLFDEPQHVADETVVDAAVATPQGAFDSLVSAVLELSPAGSALQNGARRLLESVDPQAELAAMFKEFESTYGQTPPAP